MRFLVRSVQRVRLGPVAAYSAREEDRPHRLGPQYTRGVFRRHRKRICGDTSTCGSAPPGSSGSADNPRYRWLQHQPPKLEISVAIRTTDSERHVR